MVIDKEEYRAFVKKLARQYISRLILGCMQPFNKRVLDSKLEAIGNQIDEMKQHDCKHCSFNVCEHYMQRCNLGSACFRNYNLKTDAQLAFEKVEVIEDEVR